eukprot:COSAG02_NODE_61698_length_268_cov_0.544379_1_plen_39_part_01
MIDAFTLADTASPHDALAISEQFVQHAECWLRLTLMCLT